MLRELDVLGLHVDLQLRSRGLLRLWLFGGSSELVKGNEGFVSGRWPRRFLVLKLIFLVDLLELRLVAVEVLDLVME